jgi:CRP-like cAMP-binding protein
MENRLLASLPAAELALLAPHLKQVHLLAGSVLHERGTQIESVYFPTGGAISLLAVMKEGQTVEVASIGCESAIGLSDLSGASQARTRAIVQVPGFAQAVPAPLLKIAMAQSEHIRDAMILSTELLLAQSQQIAACNALHSAEQRIARWLLQISDRIGSADIPVTQETIAQVLGVRRTTVTLCALHFQQKNLIRYRRARIAIANRTALRAVACKCYDASREAERFVQRADIEVKVSASS